MDTASDTTTKKIQSSREKACVANVIKDLTLFWEGRHLKQSRDSEATLGEQREWEGGKRARKRGKSKSYRNNAGKK